MFVMLQPDVAVVGCGPASLAAAGAIAAEGLSVVIVGPDHDAEWPNNYGVWAEQFRSLGLADTLLRLWSAPCVFAGDIWSKKLSCPYAQVDRTALRKRLLDRCRAGRTRFVSAMVQGARHDATGSTLILAGGASIRASVIVDASGHKPCLVERPGGPQALQTAYGIEADVSAHPYAAGEMTYMDFRSSHLPDRAARTEAPSFLYAMPAGPHRIFLEETCLVGRPPIPLATLKARLSRRLEHAGIEVLKVHAEEHCTIPMDAPLPRIGQRVIGFGGAAAMVNPATGYMLVEALERAPDLAAALRDGLSAPGGGPDSASTKAWSVLWSKERLLRRQVYAFGREALLGLSAPNTSAFIRAFFSLSDERWQGYLCGTLHAPALLVVMASIARTAPPALSWALARSGITRTTMSLLRATTSGGNST